MIRGLYISMTGMNAGIKRQDTIANNLANANTPGYKRSETVFSSLLEREIHRFVDGQKQNYLGILGTGSNFRLGTNDFSLGQILPSQSNLDIALSNPEAYLAVQQPNGELVYTRNGQLSVDAEGYLRHVSGAYVVNGLNPNQATRIQIQDPDSLSVSADGTLRDVQGRVIGQLRLVEFAAEATQLRLDDSLVKSDLAALPSALPGLQQGALEQANVQVVKEMVNLIAAMRYYETNAKLIQIQDQTLDKVVNEVGRT